jgi:hypothetical protein
MSNNVNNLKFLYSALRQVESCLKALYNTCTLHYIITFQYLSQCKLPLKRFNTNILTRFFTAYCLVPLLCLGGAHWLLTNAARVRSPWSAVVVYERVWLVAHSDTWVFSGCSGFLPHKWPPSAKHPCIIQDPIGNKLSSFHGLSWVNIRIYRKHVCFEWRNSCKVHFPTTQCQLAAARIKTLNFLV